jgi:hypothetical protein
MPSSQSVPVNPLAAACAASIERHVRQLLDATPDITRLALMIGATPADVTGALIDELDGHLVEEEAFDLIPRDAAAALRSRCALRLAQAVRDATGLVRQCPLAVAG